MLGSDIVWFFVGMSIGALGGLNISEFLSQKRKQQTFEQVDEQVRKDLAHYRNLNESLLDDVKFWRSRAQTLGKIKNGS